MKILSLLEKLIGSFQTQSMEHRLFNSVSLLNGIINLFGAFTAFYLPNAFLISSINFLTGILFLTFYYFSRFKNVYYRLYWPFILTILVYLSLSWFINGGSLGGSHYYFLPAIIIANMLKREENSILLYAIFMICIGSLFAWEYRNPESITAFPEKWDRYLDAGSNYLFVLILTGLLIFILERTISNERKRSESLLTNILPQEVATELKVKKFVTPRHYPSTSVMFIDMVGFTKISEQLSAEELVSEINEVFSEFDSILGIYGVEKIKTIGDAYMAVSGIPTPKLDHAVSILQCALHIQEYMKQYAERKENAKVPFFQFRLGIHSGSVITGVVGSKKFAYDVWGDTVNTASRMESSGLPGEINISKSTYDLVKDKFLLEHRGKIEAKNKGKLDMYRVLGELV